eukprot:SAG31_NODE_5397_length_2560_cov_7.077204_2_plen_237_part_00
MRFLAAAPARCGAARAEPGAAAGAAGARSIAAAARAAVRNWRAIRAAAAAAAPRAKLAYEQPTAAERWPSPGHPRCGGAERHRRAVERNRRVPKGGARARIKMPQNTSKHLRCVRRASMCPLSSSSPPLAAQRQVNTIKFDEMGPSWAPLHRAASRDCYFLVFYGTFPAESPMYAPRNPGLIEKVSPCSAPPRPVRHDPARQGRGSLPPMPRRRQEDGHPLRHRRVGRRSSDTGRA